ncbi:MAG TPA: ATP synthase F0 subunit A [Chloroflexi bacterium]|nr:ATP synthase F0 subunit A [Chloroflexota bacterium]HAL27261.1 ATP synthase F0 subunit A [Chloroflexota bacterium]
MDFLFPKGFKFPDIPSNFSLTGEPIFTIGPISYTNAHFTMLLVMILLSTFAFFATRNLREQPSGLQNVAEMLVQGLGDFVVSIGGPQAIKYLPLFGTLFLFIVTSNWLSVVPLVGQITWLHSPTADYHITFAMAFVSWLAYQTEGFRHLGFSYVKRWFNFSGFKDGPFIGAIFVMVGLIELFSELFRMLTLTLRLWGNVFGGEIMLLVMSALLLVPGLALPFVGLEVFIGLVQGLVFALLVLMYFVLAIESHDESHEEGSHSDTDRVANEEQRPEPVAA